MFILQQFDGRVGAHAYWYTQALAGRFACLQLFAVITGHVQL